jgi:hypothetical protein
VRRVRVFIFIRRGEFGSSGEESSGLHLHQERRVRVFNFIRRGEFGSSTSLGEESSSLHLHQERRVRVFRRGEFGSSSSPGEESSGLHLHQERRVRVFNFIRRGEFESSTSPGEQSSSHQLLFRCERGEAIGFAHQTERRQRAASAVSCGDFNAVPEFSESLRRPIRQED